MNTVTETDAAAQQAAEEAGLQGEVGNIMQSCPLVTVNIGVFFDGTLNNKYNVISRARTDGSYKAALSNPALLFGRYKDGDDYSQKNACGNDAQIFRRIYVEGPGSTQGEEDDRNGYAFGMGRQSGVESRVLWAFQQVLERVSEVGPLWSIGKVVFDVFGFSRGAAGARYFVNCIRAGRVRYDPWGPGDFEEVLPEGLDVEIRFLGIFDTVAAIGMATDDDNGPVNVHLKTSQVTSQIYHLTAGDEIRENFRLNRNTPGGGETSELLGAHSDVGGGYSQSGDDAPLGATETQWHQTLAEAEAAQAAKRQADLSSGANSAAEAVFVREGWMRTSETEGGIVRKMSPIKSTTVSVRHGFKTYTNTMYHYDEQLILHRPWVKLGLSRIALHMMHEVANEKTNGAFLSLPTTQEDYQIPPGLWAYEEGIRANKLSSRNRAAVLREFGHVSMKQGNFTDAIAHGPEPSRNRTEYDNIESNAVLGRTTS